MPKKSKLSPKQANQLVKGCMLFIMASMRFHGLLDKEQHEHWIEQLRDIGIFSYTLEEYEGVDMGKEKKKSFEEILKGGE